MHQLNKVTSSDGQSHSKKVKKKQQQKVAHKNDWECTTTQKPVWTGFPPYSITPTYTLGFLINSNTTSSGDAKQHGALLPVCLTATMLPIYLSPPGASLLRYHASSTGHGDGAYGESTYLFRCCRCLRSVLSLRDTHPHTHAFSWGARTEFFVVCECSHIGCASPQSWVLTEIIQ